VTGSYAGTGIQYVVPAALVYFSRKVTNQGKKEKNGFPIISLKNKEDKPTKITLPVILPSHPEATSKLYRYWFSLMADIKGKVPRFLLFYLITVLYQTITTSMMQLRCCGSGILCWIQIQIKIRTRIVEFSYPVPLLSWY
jgi:hypothetical protein